MGRYARDVSEIPLTVESTVSKFDPSGKEKKSKTSSHSLEFVKRSYAEGIIRRHLRLDKPGLHRISKDEVNGDGATAVLALMFDNGEVSATHRYHLTLHLISKRLELKITDDHECEGFDPNTVDEEEWCGETRLVLDSETLEPLSASFVAGGFPRTFGKVRYLSFSFTEEFQRVPMEGTREPFLLPAKVLLKYESDRERTVIESRYSVKQGKMP